MKKILCVMLLILLSIFSHAERLTQEELGFAIEIPDYWQGMEEEGVIIAGDPSEQAFIIFSAVEANSVEDVMMELEQYLGEFFDEVAVTEEPEEYEINGIPTIGIAGEGISEEEHILWSIGLFYNEETDNVLILVMFALAETFEEFAEDFELILFSVNLL